MGELDDLRKLDAIDLHEWDTSTFDMAIQWMYTGNVIPDIDSSQCFEQVHSYVQFFKIAEALHLSGSFKLVEQKLRAALIAAQDKIYDDSENQFTCDPTFKAALKDAFTHPVIKGFREVLASFFVEFYASHLFCPGVTTAIIFRDLFNEIEGLELGVLRLVGSSLETIGLKKPNSEKHSAVTLVCPLTGKKFGTKKKLRIKVETPKVATRKLGNN